MQPVCFAIRVIRVPRDNPWFRLLHKIEIDKRIRTWYDLITGEIYIVGKETR